MISLLANKWVIGVTVAALLAGSLAVQTARLNAVRQAQMAAAQIANQWRSNFEAMEATNAANVRAIEKLQAETRRIALEANTARQNSARIATAYETLRKGIPNAEDRALSPLLCRTFNELRRIDAQPGLACDN